MSCFSRSTLKRLAMFKNYTKSLRSLAMCAFTLGAATGANAQVTSFPWTESFEDTSPTREQWTQIYEVNTMAWTFATSPSTGGSGVTAYDGTKMANYPATSHLFDKTKLVSPVLVKQRRYSNTAISLPKSVLVTRSKLAANFL